jgi:hypothetical protein
VAQIRIKRGDTLQRTLSMKSGGVPYIPVGATFACQAKSSAPRGGAPFFDTLSVVTTLVPGQLLLTATAAQTALWPIGVLVSDIQITIGATVKSTETFSIFVDEDVTT